MPNVAGREFSYTPQGMAAAEQYKQSLGMRGGGMMGFRPIGYANGDLVEAPIDAPSLYQGGVDNSKFLMDTPGGAIPPLVATGMGRTMATRMAEGAPGGGDGGMSKAVDAVSSLVQEFTAQGVPDLARKVTNAAVATLGLPVDLVNAILKSLGVPISDTPEQVHEVNKPWRGAGYPGSAMEKYHQSGNPLEHPGVDPITGDYFPPEYFDPPDNFPDDIPAPRRNPFRATGEGTGIPQSIPSGMRGGGILSIRRR